ncbi:MAG: hypothetical protein ACSHYF_16085 [Verrucomicrobiaceae bacterium]
MKSAFLSLLFTSSALAQEALPEVEKTDFIRVHHTENSAHLQTSNTTYTKGTASITLIGAVHIADQSYYETLNKKFATYDKLLFEMIGGERMAAVQKHGEKPNLLNKAYAGMARFLELAEQKKVVDYDKDNFVHADLTIAEFQALQKKRGESILGFALKAGQDADPNTQPSVLKLMAALVTGDSDKLKLELLGTLGAGDDQIGGLAGDTVIITDRNAKCLAVLDTQLAAGHQNLAVFYGAAHFPDMEKSLLEKGYQKTKQDWLNAWSIPKEK